MRSGSTICLVVFLLVACSSYAKLSCLDNHHGDIPWFIELKYPNNYTANGTGFGYLDSKSTNGFTNSNASADAEGFALHNTILNLNSHSGISLIAFNDEPPSEEWVAWGAHAKGFIAWDDASETGVYVMHSAPKFPNVSVSGKINTTFPSNSRKYGQHFFCMSFENEDSLKNIIENLEVIYPIYYYRSGKFATPNFWNSTANSRISSVKVQDGSEFTFYSKSPNYTTGYLYENIIETHLKQGLEVESWGRPYQSPVCSPYTSVNIDNIKFSNGVGWDHYSDHSKWAVSTGTSDHNACACDINRMTSQAKRGGSCLCSTNSVLNEGLRSIITKVDKCSSVETLEDKIEALDQIVHKFLGLEI